MTVTSQVTGLPACQGTSDRPSGLFPSVRERPTGSLVHGIPADEKALEMASFSTWYLAVLPGALLHTKLCMPRASTSAPQGQLCGTHKLRPSLRPTATRTASSSSRSPQEAMGRARSQSPLCYYYY